MTCWCGVDHPEPKPGRVDQAIALGCREPGKWATEAEIWDDAVYLANRLVREPNTIAAEYLAKMVLAVDDKRKGRC